MTSERDHDIVGPTMRRVMNQGESESWDMTPETVRRNARAGWMRVLPKTSHLAIGAGVAAVLIAVLSLGHAGATRSVLQPATQPTVAIRPPAPPSTSSTATLPTTPTTSSTTATTTPGNGLWADPVLAISPQGLGAVRIGMSVAQAQSAAGVAFDSSGDGYSYRNSIPSGLHLYVGGDPVTCVGATMASQPGSVKQTVRTPDGFQLGQSVATLLRIYGSRAKLVTTTPGIEPGSGYLVTEPGGNFFFYVDTSNGTIFQIAAGTGVEDSNSCSG